LIVPGKVAEIASFNANAFAEVDGAKLRLRLVGRMLKSSVMPGMMLDQPRAPGSMTYRAPALFSIGSRPESSVAGCAAPSRTATLVGSPAVLPHGGRTRFS
jgi:hypothetical protein